ncbi:MAG: hypothetical protein M3P48_02230 [Actinomycetota bacterium]|nr:hypothetical protein [Actinomycetota bacterium]
MAMFRTADGQQVELDVGDDVQVLLQDPAMESGARALIGQVTAVRPEENAVWVRGVRADLDQATIRRLLDSDDPRNLTPPPLSAMGEE